MYSLPKGTLASAPPRPVLRQLCWPRPARTSSNVASKAFVALSRILAVLVDCRRRVTARRLCMQGR
eukprot:9498366-Pyramimonas_sp.AAC.1